MVAEELKEAIQEALKKIGLSGIHIHFEHPAELSHGDFSTNVALATAKALGKKPRDVADTVVRYIEIQSVPYLEKADIAGPGFINFHLTKEFFADSLKRIDGSFGKNGTLVGKKVMVEYTDPNPFKEFHIGHLMSNAVGESVARLVEFQGAKVVRACWQGDVGLHVAKAIWGMRKKVEGEKWKVESLGAKKWGEAYAAGSEAFDTDGNAKKEIIALNKVIFDKSDTPVNTLYDDGRKVSLAHFEEIYKVLGTKFDYYFFEGVEGRDGQNIVETNIGKVFVISDGAIVYKGEKKGLHTRVFINS